MQIPHYIERSARYFGDRPAVVFGDEVLSFRALDRRSNRLAHALLGLGLAKGERVAIQGWNSPRVVEFECALYKAGLVRVPINARQTATETLELLADSGASALLASGSHIDALADARVDLGHLPVRICLDGARGGWLAYEPLLALASDAPVEAALADGDLAVLHYSSGSTGRMKAVMQTFGNRRAALRNVVMGDPIGVRPGDTVLMMGPLTHATGVLMQPMLSRGACLHVYPRFDLDRMFDDVAARRVSHVFMVPTMLNMMMAHPGVGRVDFSGLRQLSYGAAPTTPERIREVWERVGPVLMQGYGSSEVGGGVAALSPQDHARAMASKPDLLASCGRALTEMEVAVLDADGERCPPGTVGEIAIRGESVSRGYWNASPMADAAFRPDGWYLTGDLAHSDDEGFLYIVGRAKDMIISGGFNVYTAEVEAAVQEHPAVHEVCVFGVPDATWGEAVHACVTLRPGHEAAAAVPEALLAALAPKLSPFKRPKAVSVLPELPRNPNGKIDRKALREPFWAGRGNRVI